MTVRLCGKKPFGAPKHANPFRSQPYRIDRSVRVADAEVHGARTVCVVCGSVCVPWFLQSIITKVKRGNLEQSDQKQCQPQATSIISRLYCLREGGAWQ